MFRDQDYQSLLPGMQQIAEAYLVCIAGVDSTWFSHDQLWNRADECARQADPGWPL